MRFFKNESLRKKQTKTLKKCTFHVHLSHPHCYQQLILCRCLVQGMCKGDKTEGKISFVKEHYRESKMARKTSVNILALNVNKARYCWRTGWRMIAVLAPCCVWARAGQEWFCTSTLQQNTHTEILSLTQRSEVTAGMTGLGGAVNSQGLFLSGLKATISPSSCGYPCVMETAWVCERISSVISVDFPEHPELWEERGFCTSGW